MQLNDYMNRAFDHEERGALEEALQLCGKCLEEFPEYQNEIELEIAKMNYRNGRKENALLQFLLVYFRTEDEGLCGLILNAYYENRKEEWDGRYQENYRLLENYAYFYGGERPKEPCCCPLWMGEKYIWYYNKPEKKFQRYERCAVKMEEESDAACLGSGLLWLEDIYYLEKITRKKELFLDMENPLLLVYQRETWDLFLQMQDIKGLMKSDRIVFYDNIKRLEPSFWKDGMSTPSVFAGSQTEECFSAVRRFCSQYAQEVRHKKEQAEAYYKENGEKVMEHIQSGRPKLLFITSRFTTAVQYHIRDCIAAAKELGLETELVIEKNRLCRTDTSDLILRKITEFHPDIIFIIDHFRHEESWEFLKGLKSIVWICWAQDPLKEIFSKQSALKQTERDAVISEFYSCDEFLKAEYRKDRLMYYPLVASHKIYRSYALSEKEKAEYGSDICLICHKGSAENYAKQYADNFQGTVRDFIYELYSSYIAYVRNTENVLMKPEEYRIFIQEYAKLNCQGALEDEAADLIVEDMGKHFKCLLYREQIADWLIDAGYTNLKLWGNGWSETEKYRPYAMGAAENGEIMAKILQSSKIVIGNNAYLTGPARVAETMLSGAFYLGNAIPSEVDASDIRVYLKEGEDVILWKDKEDLLNKVKFYLEHEEERDKMAARGQRKALELLTYQKFMEHTLREVTSMFS